jgi:hypothetical protein
MPRRLLPVHAWPEAWLAYGTAFLCTVIAGAAFITRGPMPVVRGTTPLPIPTPLSYQLPVFVPFGLLAGELLYRALHGGGLRQSPAFLWQLGALCIVAAIRLVFGNIPVSGHALLLAYFILYQAVTRRIAHRLRLVIGLVVLAEVAYFKVFLWDDAPTLLWGLALGGAAWAAGLLTLVGRHRT